VRGVSISDQKRLAELPVAIPVVARHCHRARWPEKVDAEMPLVTAHDVANTLEALRNVSVFGPRTTLKF
jgi:hypothetical protein